MIKYYLLHGTRLVRESQIAEYACFRAGLGMTVELGVQERNVFDWLRCSLSCLETGLVLHPWPLNGA